MEIFNIHIFEFLLIAGLALVVFGPERLPEVGRFVGKQVARFLAWQQQSPELKMITDVRSEFEREIASLRDELVRTRRQLDLSQDTELKSLRDELRPMLNLRDQPATTAAKPDAAVAQAADKLAGTPGTPTSAASVPETGVDVPVTTEDGLAAPAPAPTAPQAGASTAEAAAAPEAVPPLEIAPAVPGNGKALEAPPAPKAPEGTVQAAARPNRLAATQPTTALDRPAVIEAGAGRSGHAAAAGPAGEAAAPAPALNGSGHPPAEALPSPEEIRALMRRLESLTADVQALISGLHAQGVFGADWQPEAAINEQESLTR